ncbi:MAG: type II/IV secretion system ATPase subunit [Candidatus Hodarchaeales archaeon]|jgi:flagellar protein FlaI
MSRYSIEKDIGGMVNESYGLIIPFAYALIQTDPKTRSVRYSVVEAPLNTQEEDWLNIIKDNMTESLDIDFNKLTNSEEASDYLRKNMINIVKEFGLKLEEKIFEKLFYHVTRDFIGFGKVEPLLNDAKIEDISCDGVKVPIYIWHKTHESISTNIKFDTDDELDSFVIKVAQRSGRHISVADPLLDASLPDGSRVQLTFGNEVTRRGSTFTIRKFRSDPMTVVHLIQYNTLDEDQAAYYWYTMEHGKSVLVAGGTASGKTTLLNALAMFIREGQKIVSIEDTAEINLPHENWIPSVSRQGFGGYDASGKRRGEVSLFDLLKAALRQRPDYIFVGEVRGKEAQTLFQAMATGHAGMGTIHGDSVAEVIRRLENDPIDVPKVQLQSLDLVVVLRKVRRGRGKMVRRAIEVREVVELDSVTNELVTNKVYSWDPREDVFVNYGRSYVLEDIMNQQGLSEGQVLDELDRRKLVLRWMVKKKMEHFSQVNEVILDYYRDPDQTYDRAKRELKQL